MRANLFLAVLLFWCAPVFSITVGKIISPLEELLECKDLSWYEKIVCDRVSKDVKERLSSNNIYLESGNIVWEEFSNKSVRINTGHNCSKRLYLTEYKTRGLLLSGSKIELRGSSISRPLSFMTELDMAIDASARFRHEAGYMVFGSCNKWATDSFNLTSSVDTKAIVRVSLFLRPVKKIRDNGDIEITISPVVDVYAYLDDLNLNFRSNGRDFLSLFMDLVTIYGQFFKIAHKAIEGDSVRAEFSQLGEDFAAAFLTMYLVSTELFGENDDLGFAQSFARRKLRDEVDIFEQEQSNKLNWEIQNLFGLDSDGNRMYVFKSSLPLGYLGENLIIINSLLL